MACDTKRDANGQMTAIMCGRGPARCQWCGRQSTKLCDFPTQRTRSGTCDARMCDGHAKRVARDTDFCPNHKDKVPL